MWGTETVCVAEVCNGGAYTPPGRCDGFGGCKAGVSASCGPFPREGSRCKTTCRNDSDCLTDFFCSTNRCIPKKTRGEQCDLARQCSSEHCIDGVCCNSACGESCFSCAAVHTGKPDGTCSPVLAGSDPRDSCAVSGGTCGHDGMCDGTGNCRLAAANMPCGAESCQAGSYTPPRFCDGKGSCGPTAASKSCSPYSCGGTKCNTTCIDSSNCSADHYCSSGSCTAKLLAGSVCSTADQCISGFCGGRCCNQGCTCTQPSPGNLLKNPGFDGDLNGWQQSWAGQGEPPANATWSGVDAEGCVFSGSTKLSAQSFQTVRLFQCVEVTPGTAYNFGLRLRVTSLQGEAFAACSAQFYSSNDDCTNERNPIGTGTPVAISDGTLTTWTKFGDDLPFAGPHDAPVGARYAALGCTVNADSPGAGATVEFDLFHATRAPGKY